MCLCLPSPEQFPTAGSILAGAVPTSHPHCIFPQLHSAATTSSSCPALALCRAMMHQQQTLGSSRKPVPHPHCHLSAYLPLHGGNTHCQGKGEDRDKSTSPHGCKVAKSSFQPCSLAPFIGL